MKNYRMSKVRPLGIFGDKKAVGLLGEERIGGTHHLAIGRGHGLDFKLEKNAPAVALPLGRNERVQDIRDPRISSVLNKHFLTYSVQSDHSPELRVAVREEDEDGFDIWEVLAINHHLRGNGMVVPEYTHQGQYVMYYGDKDIRVATSKNMVVWHASNSVLASRRPHAFDNQTIKLISAQYIEAGILVLYESRKVSRGQETISIGELLCSAVDPEQVLWRSETPLHQEVVAERAAVRTLGAVLHGHDIVVYFADKKGTITAAAFDNPYALLPKAHRKTRLHRHPHNPIMSPSAFEWESAAVFNPAAFSENGRVHLLYRAMGPDGVSRIGYASSEDGINFDERLPFPVFSPTDGFGIPNKANQTGMRAYNTSLNPSGGGWAGCEDPRVVSIDGHAYMSFVAFDGWNFIRMALTAISLEDVNRKQWNWRPPTLISRPGEIHKNWVIFPEKINGKYAIIHGLSPKIHVEYIDSLDDLGNGKYIKSLPPHGGIGYQDTSRQQHWDNRVRGAGAPPLKTPMGWLLLYHATDKRDPSKYKLGAMLLDLEDPTKVLYRTNAPILEPEEWYENDGKPGVVYTCGAVIVNDNLIVYYGGGDKHIAVARANVQQFLDGLKASKPVPLQRVGV